MHRPATSGEDVLNRQKERKLTTELARHDLTKNSSGAGESERVRVIREGVASYLPDIDPEETSEWLESFDQLLARSGPSVARNAIRTITSCIDPSALTNRDRASCC